jgi:serine/threonine-protein kinase
MIGKTVSQFKITAALGKGAMGEVYLAEDTHLGRQVAVKVLPEEFKSNPLRLARFEREAKLLASLNHPNIAALYQLEEAEGVPFLVMEFIEGDTLEDRMSRAPLSHHEAVALAIQMAEGLESAHESGVIHRDLKPANIKVTPEGKLLLLDFGIAKAIEATDQDLASQATTLTAETRPGSIIGTPAYMSPEQARGEPAGKQADIWAFGCVFYEMLTCHRPFRGDSSAEYLSALFHQEPNWDALPPSTPPAIRSVLQRCLRKDTRQRLQDIGDARIELEEALQQPENVPAPESAAGTFAWRRIGGWAIAGLLAVVLIWFLPRGDGEESAAAQRFTIGLVGPLVDTGRPVAVLSPDGSRLAYVAETDNGPRIHIRALDEFEARVLAGTEGAQALFFSPDGQSLGYWAGQKIKTVSVRGGPPTVVCETAEFSGATWTDEGVIVYGGLGPLFRVAAAGGTPERLTTIEKSQGEREHEYPQMLPGGSEILFEITTGVPGESRIAVHNLGTGKNKVVLEAASFPSYSESGHLLFLRSHTIFGVAFDPRRLSVEGSPVPILENVFATPAFGSAQFAFSKSGTLVYVPRGPASPGRTLASIDRIGVVESLPGTPRMYYMPRVSPQGNKVAITVMEEGVYSVWILDLTRETLDRLTWEGSNRGAVWSPDGQRIAFASTDQGSESAGIFMQEVKGTAHRERLMSSEDLQVPTSWSPDGRTLLFTQVVSSGSEDIFALPLEGDRTPVPVVSSKSNESGAVFSPDGDWIAYSSMESGMYRVYVQAFPGSGNRVPVSGDEPGFMPVWSRDGRELFFLGGYARRKMMVVDITDLEDLRVSEPRELFEHQFGGSIGMALSRYDVSTEGSRFFFATAQKQSSPTEVHVVLNWFDELEELIPTDN